MKEKTLELKKIIELIKQNTYKKKNKKNTNPEALISSKEKQILKEEPIQRMENSEQNRRINNSETDHSDFAVHQIGHRYTNARP